MSKTHNKEDKNLGISTVISLISVLFVLSVGTAIFLLAKGYRISLKDKKIRKTGVLALSTEPTLVDISIDGKDKSSLARGITLDVGTHDIRITKDGYRDWNGTETIVEGKTTLENVMLILKDNPLTNVWNSDMTLSDILISKNNSIIIFLLKDSKNTTYVYRYKMSTYIWDFSSNPTLLTTTSDNIDSILLSSDGTYAIATISDMAYLWNFIDNTSNQLSITDVSNSDITWAANNRYIVVNSDTEIYSFDIKNYTKSTLLEKDAASNTEYLWTTDGNGYFYYVEEVENEISSVNTYNINQRPLKNKNTTKDTIVDTIYLQSDYSYIDSFRQDVLNNNYAYFVDSPENIQMVGQIKEISVNNRAEGLIVKTDIATYYYDMKTQKYIMLYPYPVEILAYSPDLKSILIKNDDNNVFIFTIAKSTSDEINTIGLKPISNIEGVSDIRWLSNSSNIYYIKDNSIYICDKTGLNQQQIATTGSVRAFVMENSRGNLLVCETTSEGFSINKYKIQ